MFAQEWRERAVAKSTTTELLKTVDIEPVDAVARASLGFAIPIGPVIIIGTDADEGIDSCDICIVIDWGDKTCIDCRLAPNACLGGGL